MRILSKKREGATDRAAPLGFDNYGEYYFSFRFTALTVPVILTGSTS